MPIAKLEPTGFSVRNGLVQLRFCFYLELGDARYSEHHIQMPVIPPEGYSGEVDEMGMPIDEDAYNAWEDGLPKVWQTNPFHNHFVRVSPDVTDAEIKKLMAGSLDEFYGIWSRSGDIGKEWIRPPKEAPGDISPENIERCELKALDIISRADSFEHKEMRI